MLRLLFWNIVKFFVNILRGLGLAKKNGATRRYVNARVAAARMRITDLRPFADYVLNHQLDKSEYVPITDRPYVPGKNPVRPIAFYLPQYYQMPSNDEWHERGFTEWFNTAKAVPQYIGHWQPHLPIDVGFYNLDTTDVMHRQIELAKMYGVYGFCFYYYWFSGERLMDKPIFNMLADKSLGMPFMLFWANENWTKNWGTKGKLGEKFYDAKVKPGDAQKFIDDIMPFWSDNRYIKIEGRPALIVYKYKQDPNVAQFINDVKQICHDRGQPAPYIMVMDEGDISGFHPKTLNADAVAEFTTYLKNPLRFSSNPPHVVNPRADLRFIDMEWYIKSGKHIHESEWPLFKGAMTTFDNTARRVYIGGGQICEISPELYHKWMSDIIKWTQEHGHKDKFIFISAWNEWAEGMHLEPDQKYGYAYLEMTKKALEDNNA